MNDKPMLAFWEHLQFFVRYVNELQFMYAACVLLLKSINKWVERMVVRKGLSPLSWLMYEIVNSVGQVNFTFVGKKSGNFRNLRLWQPCGNHVWSRQVRDNYPNLFVNIVTTLAISVLKFIELLLLPATGSLFHAFTLSDIQSQRLFTQMLFGIKHNI